MTDVMLLGVLRMPITLWRDDEIDKNQRHARYVEAANRIEVDGKRIAELEEAIRNWEQPTDWQTKYAALEAGIRHRDIQRDKLFALGLEKDKRIAKLEAAQAISTKTLEAKIAVMHVALTKINAIRGSIIGFQNINWSEHIYPLVAALQESGYEGKGYPAEREYAGSLVDQIAELEAALGETNEALAACQSQAAGRIADLEEQNEHLRDCNDMLYSANEKLEARIAELEAGANAYDDLASLTDKLQCENGQLERRIAELEAELLNSDRN